MKQEYNPDTAVLDQEEQLFIDADDDFVPVANQDEVRVQLSQAARNTLEELDRKTERMNIRMTKSDMAKLKSLASQEGLPYQSLVTSILHKYTHGRLVDIQEAKKLLHG